LHASSQRTRILFFRQGAFSNGNDRVAGWLREQFPDLELVQIDVLQDVIKSSRSVVWRAAAAALAAYPGRIARRERDFRDFFFRTPYLFHAIRRMIRERCASLAASALFSFQTQSIYDASIDGLPHFLYTDHTHLANLTYPGADHRRLYSPAWIELEHAIYRSARVNMTMSGFVQDSIIRDYHCDPARVAVVGGAPNTTISESAPDNDGYANRTILFVGIDWERKGGPVLVEAFRRVLQKLPDARLIIAGCSPAISLPNVEVLGRVPLPEVSRLILRSSVVVLPSLREPHGIITIEAMMHGIPTVVTRIGAMPEVVDDGQCGRVVPPGDAPALAAALVDLLSDPLLCRQYGMAAREKARACYTGAVVSKKIGDTIREALEYAPAPAK